MSQRALLLTYKYTGRQAGRQADRQVAYLWKKEWGGKKTLNDDQRKAFKHLRSSILCFFVVFLFCFMLFFVYLSACKRSKLTKRRRKALSQRPHFPLSQSPGMDSSWFSVLFDFVLFVSVLFLFTSLFANTQTRFNGQRKYFCSDHTFLCLHSMASFSLCFPPRL